MNKRKAYCYLCDEVMVEGTWCPKEESVHGFTDEEVARNELIEAMGDAIERKDWDDFQQIRRDYEQLKKQLRRHAPTETQYYTRAEIEEISPEHMRFEFEKIQRNFQELPDEEPEEKNPFTLIAPDDADEEEKGRHQASLISQGHLMAAKRKRIEKFEMLKRELLLAEQMQDEQALNKLIKTQILPELNKRHYKRVFDKELKCSKVVGQLTLKNEQKDELRKLMGTVRSKLKEQRG